MHAYSVSRSDHVFRCAWCDGAAAGPLLPPEQITHGICDACLRRCTDGGRVERPPEAPAPPPHP